MKLVTSRQLFVRQLDRLICVHNTKLRKRQEGEIVVTRAVASVDGDDVDGCGGGGGRGEEVECVPGGGIDDAEEGGVEVGELEGEELGGYGGAVEWCVGP